MSDSFAAFTAIIAAGAAVCTAVVPIVNGRLKRTQDQGATQLASWSGLNSALNREVERLNSTIAAQRADFDAQLQRQRDTHTAEMSAAHAEIGRLQNEVAALRNIVIGNQQPHQPPLREIDP